MNTGADNLSPKRQPARSYQISLGALLVVMLIFIVMSAGLFYSSRIEVVQEELKLFFGITPSTKSSPSRRSHLMFLLFTYASPLMMAALLSTIVSVMNRRR